MPQLAAFGGYTLEFKWFRLRDGSGNEMAEIVTLELPETVAQRAKKLLSSVD